MKQLFEEIKVELVEIKADLQYHIKRTDISEQRLDYLEDSLRLLIGHLHKIEGMIALVKWSAGGVAVVWTLTQIAHFLLTYR